MMSCSTKIGGVRFDNVSMQEAVDEVVRLARKSSLPNLVCTANLDHLERVASDREFRAIYETASLVVADGMPIVWLSRLAGMPLKERVAGSDLFIELARASHETGLRLYLLGGQPGSADTAISVLCERFPRLQIAGSYCPPIETFGTPDEDARIIKRVRDSKPDILLVGLGSPKQEKWIDRHKSQLNVPVSIGVGASFDMAAGKVQRAPMWVRRSGLEWVFRLAQEPRRLWERYMGRDLPYFLALVLDVARRRGRGAGQLDAAADEIRHAA